MIPKLDAELTRARALLATGLDDQLERIEDTARGRIAPAKKCAND